MKTVHKVTDTRVVRVHHKTGHGNLGEILGPSGVDCKGAKAKQEELGSSLSVDELAEGDLPDRS